MRVLIFQFWRGIDFIPRWNAEIFNDLIHFECELFSRQKCIPSAGCMASTLPKLACMRSQKSLLLSTKFPQSCIYSRKSMILISKLTKWCWWQKLHKLKKIRLLLFAFWAQASFAHLLIQKSLMFEYMQVWWNSRASKLHRLHCRKQKCLKA